MSRCRPADPLEAKQHRPPVEAGAEGGQEHQISLLDPALLVGVGQGDGHRGGTGVAVLLFGGPYLDALL